MADIIQAIRRTVRSLQQTLEKEHGLDHCLICDGPAQFDQKQAPVTNPPAESPHAS